MSVPRKRHEDVRGDEQRGRDEDRRQRTWGSGLAKTIAWYRENAQWISNTRNGAYRDYYKVQYGTEVGGD